MNLFSSIIFTCVCFFHTTESARILGVFPITSYSHYTLGSTLMKELAVRGHDVTMISPFPENSVLKNFRHIELTGLFEAFEEARTLLLEEDEMNFIQTEISLNGFVIAVTEIFFSRDSVKQLLNSDEMFDLVIVEDFLNYAFSGFCYRFKTPCISVSALGLSRIVSERVGNPLPPSHIPDFKMHFGSSMNFFQRLDNSLAYLFGQVYKHWYTLPLHNQILQTNFPGAPDIKDLHYNVSLVFVNAHIAINPAVPYVPNVIDIGGCHVKPPKQLPKDLQEYLDSAKEGVIVFSMGSNLKSIELPVEKREAILKAFSRLKEKVLWKWEDAHLPGKPANVKIEKWLPQSDVLAHPNVKLFITHGGLFSTTEAVYHGVPILGIPVFGDQKFNLVNAISNGIALEVPYSQLTEDALFLALQELLANPKYSENAKRRSKIMHDQPMKPLDKAVFWIEYVIRHQGAPHLRSAALNLHWYQYFLLDVVLFCFLALCIVIVILTCLFKVIFCRSSSQKVSVRKKKD